MEVYSGLTLSDDGVVTGEWSECSSSLLLRNLRKARSENGDWLSDVFVLARLAHEVLSESSAYRYAPVFSEDRPTSLCIAMMKVAQISDWDAFDLATDNDVVAATNIARWILRLPQQTSSTVVFVEGPGTVSSPRVKVGVAS